MQNLCMQNFCRTESYAELRQKSILQNLLQNSILCRTYAEFNPMQNLCRIVLPIKATLEEPHPTSQLQEVDFLVSNRKFINRFESQQYAQPYRMMAMRLHTHRRSAKALPFEYISVASIFHCWQVSRGGCFFFLLVFVLFQWSQGLTWRILCMS